MFLIVISLGLCMTGSSNLKYLSENVVSGLPYLDVVKDVAPTNPFLQIAMFAPLYFPLIFRPNFSVILFLWAILSENFLKYVYYMATLLFIF